MVLVQLPKHFKFEILSKSVVSFRLYFASDICIKQLLFAGVLGSGWQADVMVLHLYKDICLLRRRTRA